MNIEESRVLAGSGNHYNSIVEDNAFLSNIHQRHLSVSGAIEIVTGVELEENNMCLCPTRSMSVCM